MCKAQATPTATLTDRGAVCAKHRQSRLRLLRRQTLRERNAKGKAYANTDRDEGKTKIHNPWRLLVYALTPLFPKKL